MTQYRSEKLYFEEDLIELLIKAEALGFSVAKGSEIEKLTISELDRLVNQIV